MSRQGTVVASLLRTLLDGASAAGMDRAALAQVAGVEEARLDPDSDRVPYDAYVALWEEVSRRTGDPFFGLHLCESAVDADTFSVVGFAARSCDTYGDAIERVIRYSALLNDTTETRLDVVGGRATVTDGHRDPSRPWPRHKAECILAAYVVLGRRWTGADFEPREARFQHARPGDVSELARVFRCPLRFGQARNELVFDAALLALPILHAEPRLLGFLERRAAVLLPAAERSPVEDVRRAVADLLPGGDASLVRVAKKLGLSARTLQRRLRDDGVAYTDLVDDVRRALALRMLGEGAASVSEIGYLLGFSDPRAFRRAFRRWTGRSPRETRAGEGPVGADVAGA